MQNCSKTPPKLNVPQNVRKPPKESHQNLPQIPQTTKKLLFFCFVSGSMRVVVGGTTVKFETQKH